MGSGSARRCASSLGTVEGISVKGRSFLVTFAGQVWFGVRFPLYPRVALVRLSL